MALDKNAVLDALKAANAARPEPTRPSGCGRAYVVVTDKTLVRSVSAACKSLGLMFLKKAYGTGDNAIYMGYDNGSGVPLGKAKAFAEVLRSKGISCYDDAVGD